MNGLTLDSGALIALERKKRRVAVLVDEARARGHEVSVPMPVLVEWWRGSPEHVRLRRAFEVIPLDESTARSAGRALGVVGAGPSAVDAVVMATAARRGDVVLTSDLRDLQRLQQVFPGVRLLGV